MSIDPEQYTSSQPTAIRRILATSPGIPSRDIVDAFEDGLVNVLRRVEIYEADGDTLWNPLDDDPDFERLIDGGVTVDSNADERRVLDLTLDNRDFLLRPDPTDGLWYDKIIKVYRGIVFVGGEVAPKAVIAEYNSSNQARLLKQFLATLGYLDVDTLLEPPTVDNLQPYQVIFSYKAEFESDYLDIYQRLWRMGHHIFTFGSGTQPTEMLHYDSEDEITVDGDFVIVPTTEDSPVAGSFEEGPGGTGTGWVPLTVAAGVLPLALGRHPVTDAPTVTASLVTSSTGGYWVDLHLPSYANTQTKLFIRAISNWVRGVGMDIEWETQIGEFMIDGLNWAQFPNQMKITGRDYVKKMKQSKLGQPTTFVAGTKVRDLVRAVAINSGINANKMRIGIGSEALVSDMSFDAGTDRWQIAKDACIAFNYEIFFDAFGWLVVRKFLDPSTSDPAWTFKTGDDGNLVTFDKSLNDSEIYNHIIVTSSPAGEELVMPYFGEAINNDPKSPTNTDRLGDRVLPIETDYLPSDEACAELAKAMLKIHALEQYQLNTTTAYYPWMEVGEIVEILDPDATEIEPTRYLLDSLNYPLALGPMSGTGKRITLINSSGDPSSRPASGGISGPADLDDLYSTG